MEKLEDERNGLMAENATLRERLLEWERAADVFYEQIQEATRLHGETRQLYLEAQKANRLKDDFMALVSHELRTPLIPILGWAQLLKDDSDDLQMLRKGLDTIERNARLQSQLIDDLLDVSRITTGKLRVDLEPTDLTSVASETVSNLASTARAKNLDLRYQCSEPAVWVHGDRTRLQQVLWNLVVNAIKFTSNPGSVVVQISTDAKQCTLTVNDTGIGIERDFLPHVFEQFRQAESAQTRKHAGLGLGLTIVKNVVELHGGRVWADSKGLGFGSHFVVELPKIDPPVKPKRRPTKDRL